MGLSRMQSKSKTCLKRFLKALLRAMAGGLVLGLRLSRFVATTQGSAGLRA